MSADLTGSALLVHFGLEAEGTFHLVVRLCPPSYWGAAWEQHRNHVHVAV